MKFRTSLSLFLASSSAALLPLACSAEPIDTAGGGGGSALGGSAGAGGTSGQSGIGGGSAGVGGNATGGGGVMNTGGSSGGSAGSGAGAGNVGGGGAAGNPSGGTAGSANAGAPPGGAAGTGGMSAGSGGTSAGRGGAAGSGGATATGSPGCGKSTTQALNQWVQTTVMSGRTSAVFLPTGYDPMRAYPVIVLLHGCSGGTNNLPMERQTGTDAIVVRGTGSAADTCWDSGANGADVAFVDAMVADTKARFCTDTTRFFAVGYSSGSWLANQLGCIRANVFRGLATVAGGNPGVRNCVGPIAHMFVHDRGDTSNVIAGSISARDRLLTQNGCDMTTMPQDPSPCVRYQGCDPGYPVVWCETTGQNHNRQDSLAPAMWTFFEEF